MKTMPRWIDAEYLVDIIQNEEKALGYVCYSDIVNAPELNLITCKDCEYFGKCSVYEAGNFNSESFCSKGVRKD